MSTSREGLSLQVLAVAEQAFLAFLEDTQEGFNIMTQHAARRRAVRNQTIRNSSSSSSSSDNSSGSNADLSTSSRHRSPAIVFTAVHVDFMNRLGDVMARLPRGNAGQPLYAIASSIKTTLSAVQ